MKRFTLILLSIMLIVGCLGCHKNEAQLEKPAKFYYPNKDINYGVENGLISYELQETVNIGNDLHNLILQYQQGPISNNLINLLIPDININAVETKGGVITVSTDASFLELSGIDRTIASACISMTLLDYTNAKYIKIHIVDDLHGEDQNLIISKKDLHLFDNSPVPTNSN